MSIWSTPECDAWSRDFDYDNYLSLHNAYRVKGPLTANPVSEKTYYLFKAAFQNQMEEDFLKLENEAVDVDPELS